MVNPASMKRRFLECRFLNIRLVASHIQYLAGNDQTLDFAGAFSDGH